MLAEPGYEAKHVLCIAELFLTHTVSLPMSVDKTTNAHVRRVWV